MKTKIKPQYLLLEIFAVVAVVVVLYPFFLILINSAKESFTITQYPMAMPENWSLIQANVQRILDIPSIRYGQSFVSSVIITTLSLLALTIFSSMGAWVLVRTDNKVSQIIFLFFVAAMVIPFQVIMFPLLSWFKTVSDFTGIKLLRTYQGIVLAYLGFGLSLSVFMYHGFIKGIPLELEEAATIDGCSQWQIFSRIIAPLLTPIHATIMVLHGIWIWNDYLLPLLVLGQNNKIQTIPLAVASFAGAYVKQWDLILTAILLAIIPVIIFFLFAQRFIIRGIVAGSSK